MQVGNAARYLGGIAAGAAVGYTAAEIAHKADKPGGFNGYKATTLGLLTVGSLSAWTALPARIAEMFGASSGAVRGVHYGTLAVALGAGINGIVHRNDLG